MAGDRYEQIEKLGQGMMSDVWLVRDTTTHELVVLKVMTTVSEDDKRDQKARERFLREIEITQSLQHPHILPIIDSGEIHYQGRSVPYYVTPYITEGSLAEVIKRLPPWKSWSLVQIGDAIVQAAESIWYLHTRKPLIVHQDIKPGNFLCQFVESSQRIVYLYLCDFGISRWQKTSNAAASEILGTFAYMAPEQAEGIVDRASDQYALAIMACYMLTGKLPIQAATNKEYIEAHLHDRPLTPSELYAERLQSEEVDAVILRALAKRPQDRFPTILEFAQALHQALGNVIEHGDAGDRENTEQKQFERRNSGVFVPVEPQKPLKPSVPLKEKESDGANIPIFIDALDTSSRSILDEPLPQKPLKPLASATPPRNTAISFSPLAVRHVMSYDLPARPRQLCWSRSGSALVCVLYGQPPLYLSGSGMAKDIQVPLAGQAACASWSPDGKVVAISTPNAIRFWDVTSQAVLPLTIATNDVTVEGMDWSSKDQLAIWLDNHILIYALSPAALMMPQPPLSHHVATGPMRCGNIGTVHWSPDGSFLAAGGANGMLVSWSIARIAPAWHIAPIGQKVYGLSWSPDGAIFAAAFKNNRVVGWDTHTRQMLFAWEKLPAMPRTLTIAPTQYVTIASSEQRILCGLPQDAFPAKTVPGQLLASWSSAYPNLATLDSNRQSTLMIWRQA